MSEKKVIAYLIESDRLQTDMFEKPMLWLALIDGFKSPDGNPVFYAEEIPLLSSKTTEQLRKIYEVKKIFPGSLVEK